MLAAHACLAYIQTFIAARPVLSLRRDFVAVGSSSSLKIESDLSHGKQNATTANGNSTLARVRMGTDVYPWYHRGRDIYTDSATVYTAPSDFSAGPSWVWQNELDEQVRHSPLIDNEHSIYVTTASRIRKFSPDGKLLWTWQSGADEGKMVSSPALYEGALYAVSSIHAASLDVIRHSKTSGTVAFSIDMANGHIIWKRLIPVEQCTDASSVFVYNKTFIMPLISGKIKIKDIEGNDMIYAVSTSDGSHLWDYVADEFMWNWTPSSPGDGTLLTAGSCGSVWRLTFHGELVWRTGRVAERENVPNAPYCSCGGGALGPNGIFYVVTSDFEAKTGGVVLGYKVSDGELLWSRSFKDERGMGGHQYPSIGRLGADGPLVVVAALGVLPVSPPSAKADDFQLELFGDVLEWPGLPNAVVAMDAASGKILWRFDGELWHQNGVSKGPDGLALLAAGDNKYDERRLRLSEDPRADIGCAPDTGGIPVISGDGTVYASSSHGGALRAMKDVNGNGVIEPSEISVFETHNCFLNSVSLAPGMLVAAPCWGPMYVFKTAPTPLIENSTSED